MMIGITSLRKHLPSANAGCALGSLKKTSKIEKGRA